MPSFAILDYIKNKNQIPTRFNILKKAPDFIWDWYIKKFNPIYVQELNFKKANGFLIKLPVQKNDDPKKISLSLKKTFLNFNDLQIVQPLDNFLFDYEPIKISNGNFITALLSYFIINSIIKSNKKNLADTEIFILDENKILTQILLDSLYSHVNYLTLITDKKDFYLQKQSEIFADSGLNLQIIDYNKSIISEADIIFDTGLNKNFVYAIKKNAIYFDLNNQNISRDIKIMRPDIKIIKKINLYYQDILINNTLLEMIFYCSYNEFKAIFNKKYNKKLFLAIQNKINQEQIIIS